MDLNSMVYEGVGFNVNFILEVSVIEFVSYPGNQSLWPGITNEKREQRLTDVYNLVNSIYEDRI